LIKHHAIIYEEMEVQLQVLTSAMVEVNGQFRVPVVLRAEKGPQWKLYRRMGGPEGLSLLDIEP
jgi:hypothetical protein